jgi:ketosteroid isomerase-like protein
MSYPLLIIGRLARLHREDRCDARMGSRGDDDTGAAAGQLTLQSIPMSQDATVKLLKGFLDAFNRHDLDAIMEFFAEDCVFYMPRGASPRGDRYIGKKDVRAGLAKRLREFRMFITETTVTGLAATSGSQSGRSQAHQFRGRVSKCGASTCWSTSTARSRARIPSGRSWSDRLEGVEGYESARTNPWRIA